MLKDHNDNVLLRKGINAKYLFFYQRWTELLNNRTLDMHQYNILNICVACEELLEIVDLTLSGLLTSRENIIDAKDEALLLLKEDDVLKSHNHSLYNSLLNIVGSKIDTKSKSESIDDKSGGFYISLRRLKYQLTTPVRLLKGSYHDYIMTELKKDLDAGNKEKMQKHMSLLISQCIYEGWSANGLYALSSLVEYSDDYEQIWANFANTITPSVHTEFTVFYGVKLETRYNLNAEKIKSTLIDLGFDLKKGQEITSSLPHFAPCYSHIKRAPKILCKSE